ncbi:MAG: DegT/DnrJ/EryC1/StrS family aminotransferase, partial [candidate division NC10 bacterium]|nr:DegT/DnrJ/EryC1/StrS family aminotransferase [candidate division NC10 bacterium]
MKKRKEFLPFSRPTIEEEEIQEVIDCLRSGWITTGPRVLNFEEEFKKYVGSGHAVALSSGTAGLHLAYMAAGIGPGDEVITTPFTFAATVNMIVLNGARPVFVDIERESFNIDVTRVKEKITHRTKAVVPVHFAGQPCDMDEILAIARRHNLLVIEDAAHALGTRYKGRMVGGIGDIAVFSFHPTKNITTGEGGMVSTDNAEYAEKVRLLRFHGISKEAWSRYRAEGSPQYEIQFPGFKYNMMDIQAAIGLHQLRKLDRFLEIRSRYALMYNQALAGIPEIITPGKVPYEANHAWHLYTILIDIDRLRRSRDEFIARLKEENIGAGIHFPAIHLQPYYRKAFGFKRGDYTNAEYVSDRILSLPLFPGMTEGDVEDVVAAVKG